LEKKLNKKSAPILVLSGISLRIWLPFAVSITAFILAAGFYYPKKQEQIFVENYRSKIKELSKTVALGVELTLSTDNFEGLKKTIDLAKSSSEFEFIAIIEKQKNGSEQVFQVNPDSFETKNILKKNTSAYIYEKCDVKSDFLNGYVLIAFSKEYIKNKIYALNYPVYQFLVVLLIISLIAFLFFANTISRPIRKLTIVANQLERQNFDVDINENTGANELSNLNNALFSLKIALINAKKRNEEFNKELENKIEIRTKDLKETTEKLIKAQTASSFGNFEFDVRSAKWTFSKVINQILYLENTKGPIDNWLNTLCAEDNAEIVKSFEDAIVNKQSFQKDFKLNFADASKPEKWVTVVADPQFDTAGSVISVSGSFQDITDRKLIENEVNKLSLVAKKTSNCVIITDKHRKITWVNDSLLKLTGYGMEELIGISPKIFQSPKTNPDTLDHLKYCLDNDLEVNVEILNVDKYGKEYWLDMNIVPIFDQNNELIGYIAVEVDITERKRTEDELIRREKMLLAISTASNILLNSFNTLDSISKTLDIMGKAVGVDRTYLFTNVVNPELGILASQRFEWNSGSAAPQIDNPEMQNFQININKDFLNTLSAKLPFFKQTKSIIDGNPLKEVLESQGILSFLIIPIFKNDFFWGYVGFDDCTNERVWSEAEISILTTFANAIENALDREDKTETIKSMALFPELNPNPVIRIDFDGKIILENDAADKIHYLTFDAKLVSKDEFLSIVSTLLTHERNKLQFEVQFNEDNFYTVDCLLIEDSKQINLYFNDISQLKENEQQLREAKIRAEASDKAKEEFIANMSHEIRTPLHAITGLSKILTKSNMSAEDLKLVSHIAQSGDHLHSLINNVLDFTKITAGEFKLNISTFSFRHVVKQLQSILFSIADEKGLKLDFNVSDQIHELLIGDETRLRQALLNLLSNSLKFTEIGKVSLTARQVEDNENSQLLEIIISDTGIGMSEGFIGKIFDKFSQEDSSLGRKYGGTGLGMAITKGLVDLMQGTITVDSQKDKGTTFVIHIPFEKNLQKIDKEARDKTAKNKLNHIKVLVVEDNDINLLVASTLLEFYGITVFEAKNGKEAIEHPNLRDVELILMDLQMPVMDGFAATIYLRKNLKLETPIVALTANALKTEIERCFELGMNDYVLKPYNENQLMDAITKNLNLFAELEHIEKHEEKPSDELYNLDMLRKLSAGSNEFMNKIIAMFLEQIPDSVSNLKAAFEAGDYETTKSIAHRIKATYIQFGIKILEQDIFLLNYFDVSADDDIEKCKSAVRNLVEITAKVVESLAKITA
jgi:PAS domain S-box-containing protein